MEYIDLWDKIPFYDLDKQTLENENTATLSPFIIDDNKKHPAVIVVPGGGYDHRATEKKIKVSKYLNSIGINAFLLNYRVLPYMHPIELNDCKRAIRFIKYNAEKYNVIKEKVSIIGFSAGAHLAGTAVLTGDEYDFEKIDEIDKEDASIYSLGLCYPVVSLYKDFAHKGSGNHLLGDDLELKKALSLENLVKKNMPPVFMWHTFEDKSVSILNSLEMAKALKENEVSFEYHIFPEGKHGSALAEDIEGTNKWSELYKDWLRRIKFL